MIELMVESRTVDENEISWKGKYEEFNSKGFITTLRPKKIKTLNFFIIYFAFLKQCTCIG
jgi:hypothetical protein